VVVGVDSVSAKLSCTVIHAPIEEVFRATTNDDDRGN
jgi:uncharacterized protein YndB with AHSA1/START domain